MITYISVEIKHLMDETYKYYEIVVKYLKTIKFAYDKIMLILPKL